MWFSTYKYVSYIGLAIFPFLTFGVLSLGGFPAAAAIVGAIILTLIMLPLQLWQLSRLQDRLDDYGGSIPLGWAFDWDLEDDKADSDDPIFTASPWDSPS